MINIADIHDCFGCGVCAKACPKQIIALKLNKNGFYEPRIESADQCIKCSICVEVCAFAADSQVIDLKPTSYAAWSLNDDIRKNSSSGGIAFEIGRQMLQQGFKICVVRYNYAKQIPEHYIARNEEELAASAGSKYLQSDTTDGFAGIDIHDKYVVTGTPCQIEMCIRDRTTSSTARGIRPTRKIWRPRRWGPTGVRSWRARRR